MGKISLLSMQRRRRNRNELLLRNGSERTLIDLLEVVDSWVECLEVFLLYVPLLPALARVLLSYLFLYPPPLRYQKSNH